jgi:hypothetical protein
MNHRISFFFVLALSLVLEISSNAQGKQLELWYKHPAAEWTQALPVGNGRIGAMVYGQPWNEIIQLNEESLWAGCRQECDAEAGDNLAVIQQKLLDGKIEEASRLAEQHLTSNPLRIRSYQSFGKIRIDFFGGDGTSRFKYPVPAELPSYRRSLDIENGLSVTEYSDGKVTYRKEVFASAVDNVIVIGISADKPGALSFRLSFRREIDASAVARGTDEIAINGQIIDLPLADATEPGEHMKFAGLIKGFNKGGSLKAISNSLLAKNCDEVISSWPWTPTTAWTCSTSTGPSTLCRCARSR